jgi:hypothetical protein
MFLSSKRFNRIPSFYTTPRPASQDARGFFAVFRAKQRGMLQHHRV